MSLAAVFPDGRISPPATNDDIAAAERELGVPLPEALRALYLESNGFREPMGNAAYLFTLDELLKYTKWLWNDFVPSLPEVTSPQVREVKFPDFAQFIFFGMSSGNTWWGVRVTAPNDVVGWDHYLLDEGPVVDPLGADILEVMQSDFAIYATLDEQPS